MPSALRVTIRIKNRSGMTVAEDHAVHHSAQIAVEVHNTTKVLDKKDVAVVVVAAAAQGNNNAHVLVAHAAVRVVANAGLKTEGQTRVTIITQAMSSNPILKVLPKGKHRLSTNLMWMVINKR